MAYLLLSPAFGGLAFGPFPNGTMLLGSDGQRCAVTLLASLGIAPVHAQLTWHGDGSATIQPAERGAAIFRVGGARVETIASPVRLRPGEAFALGSAQGPAFTLATSIPGQPAAPPPGAARRPATGRDRLSAGSLGREVQRQVNTEAQRNFGFLSQLGFAARSGALLQPRYVVGALIAVGGTMVVGCGGLLAAAAAWLHR